MTTKMVTATSTTATAATAAAAAAAAATLHEGGMTEAQRIILSRKTPVELVKTRLGPGGKELLYIEHADVTSIIAEAFGLNWDFEILGEPMLLKNGEEVVVKAKLTVYDNQGTPRSRMQFGGAKKIFPDQEIGDVFKAAGSDALKKCASLLGIGLDLYRKEEREALEAELRREKAKPTPRLMNQLLTIAEECGYSKEDIEKGARDKYGHSLSEMSSTEVAQAITNLAGSKRAKKD